MAAKQGLVLQDKTDNPANVMRNSYGRRRIFIDAKTNPCMVYLNSDLPGKAVFAQIRKVIVDTQNTSPYFQLDFGGACHTEANVASGAKSNYFQVTSGNGESIRVPIRFLSDHIPQNFKLSVYGSGEPADLITLGNNGVQIFIQYEFIAQ
jgi:hypothetical protein